jgi:hypothetical protein
MPSIMLSVTLPTESATAFFLISVSTHNQLLAMGMLQQKAVIIYFVTSHTRTIFFFADIGPLLVLAKHLR